MNQSERDALRKKHTPTIGFVGWSESEHRFTEGMVCDKCSEFDGQSKWGEWPCDTIKVLDAWDFERNMQKLEDISKELGLPE